jgi:hypothetical protein
MILVAMLSCEKSSSDKKCWDCYYIDNQTNKQTMPNQIFCDLTAEQMDTVQYDQGKCNSVSRKCFNMEFPYAKP